MRSLPLKTRWRTISCDCGLAVQVSDSQAGETISCAECGRTFLVPSLTALKLLPAEDRADPSQPPQRLQYGLRRLMAFMAGAALLATAAHYVGVAVFLAGLLCILAPAVLFTFLLLGTVGAHQMRLWFWDYFFPLPPDDI